MKRRLVFVLVACLVPAAATAQLFGSKKEPQTSSQAQAGQTTAQSGVVSWQTLQRVDLVKQGEKFLPKFSPEVLALDKKDVKLQGFIYPLDMGEKQKRFLLSAMPSTCAFCLPGGPESLVEVTVTTAVKYSFDPITVSGKLSVLKEDKLGLFYRIENAQVVSN